MPEPVKKSLRSKWRRNPKGPTATPKPAEVAMAKANLAVRVRRRCLGRWSGRDTGGPVEHFFMSTGPENRICAACRNRQAAQCVSPTMLNPMTAHAS
jgi:hypothetical protein